MGNKDLDNHLLKYFISKSHLIKIISTELLGFKNERNEKKSHYLENNTIQEQNAYRNQEPRSRDHDEDTSQLKILTITS